MFAKDKTALSTEEYTLKYAKAFNDVYDLQEELEVISQSESYSQEEIQLLLSKAADVDVKFLYSNIAKTELLDLAVVLLNVKQELIKKAREVA